MKKPIVPALITLMLFSASAPALAQKWSVDTTCLRLYFKDSLDNARLNRYSIMVDTCDSSRTWMRQGAEFWTKRRKTLRIPQAPADSIVEVQWTAIDSSETELRAGMKLVYDSIGRFVIRKVYPQDTLSGVYFLKFSSYVPCDPFMQLWYELRSLIVELSVIPAGEGSSGICSDAAIVESIYPNPSTDVLNVTFTRFPRAMYVMNVLGQTQNCPVHYLDDFIAQLYISTLTPGAYWLCVDGHAARFLVK